MAIVEFRNVDIVFGERPLEACAMLDAGEGRETILQRTGQVVGVHDASASIEEGEICVLMGLSGSGKSTLLRAVNGLNKATRGEVLIGDIGGPVDVTRCDGDTLRRLRMQRISMVFQQFALLPWRSVAENVGLGLELRGMAKAERSRIVDDKLRLVDLQQWRDKFAHELSGGMQQRVGLARAFATDADILLMDEPFSALDPLIRSHLQDELLTLQRSLRKTIIFVSHDLDEALKVGTHIAIMEAGRIVQFGEPEEIVLAPADQYVADFVAHMNPLNVLRGASLMTPIGELRRDGDSLWLDSQGRHRVWLDAAGRPSKFVSDGRSALLRDYDSILDLEGLDASEPTLMGAAPDISMRAVIEIRHATGLPVALIDGGRLIGVVGDAEIFRGMLRQTSLGTAPRENDMSR